MTTPETRRDADPTTRPLCAQLVEKTATAWVDLGGESAETMETRGLKVSNFIKA